MQGMKVKDSTEHNKLQSIMVMHVCAHLENKYLWPDLTSKHFSEVSNSADPCSTLWNMRENYIEQQESYSHECEKAPGKQPESAEILHWVINDER